MPSLDPSSSMPACHRSGAGPIAPGPAAIPKKMTRKTNCWKRKTNYRMTKYFLKLPKRNLRMALRG